MYSQERAQKENVQDFFLLIEPSSFIKSYILLLVNQCPVQSWDPIVRKQDEYTSNGELLTIVSPTYITLKGSRMCYPKIRLYIVY